MTNKKTGFLYFSKLSTELLSIFTQVNRLAAIQSENIVNIGIGGDDLSIDIHVEDREDLSEGSVLITVTTEGISVDDSEIETIFNNILDGREYLIKTNSELNIHMCGVNLGSVVDSSYLNEMFDLIKRTTTTPNIVSLLPIIGSTLDVTKSGMIAQPLDSERTQTEPSTLVHREMNFNNANELNMEDLVLKVTKEVIKHLTEDSSELQSLLLNIKKDRSEIIRDVVKEVKDELSKIEVEPTAESTLNISTLADVAPTIATFGIESTLITSPLNNLLDNIEGEESVSIDKPTDIYNNLIKLSCLVEGCESDIELFRKVMENKDRLSTDDIDNACTFNMYEKLINNDVVKLGNRETVTRRNRLGL